MHYCLNYCKKENNVNYKSCHATENQKFDDSQFQEMFQVAKRGRHITTDPIIREVSVTINQEMRYYD